MISHTIIRTEQEQDYFQIAELHALAFDYSLGMGEVLLVDALRHRKAFDKELSLVAEVDGRIVGHVLFNPIEMKVGGVFQRGVNLAPIAVHPSFQNRGIGTLLIEEGHKRSIEKGYQFSILLGDPNYYSRFGYTPNMFGSAAAIIQREAIRKASAALTLRRVKQADIQLLMSMWEDVYGNNELATKPSPSLLNWISTSTSMSAAIIEENNEPIGYIRFQTHSPKNISVFLAKDENAATRMIEYMNEMIIEDVEKLVLPIHPHSTFAENYISYPFSASLKAWGPGMLKILNPENQQITSYIEKVSKDEAKIGLVIWPVEFDNC